MKKVMIGTLLFVSVTALPAIAANDNLGVNKNLNEEQVQQQQDIKRKEVLDNMQIQAQKRNQRLQQQSTEIKRQQNRIGKKNNNSSVNK